MGHIMQTIRKERGYTQKQLAEKCGLATGTIQQYELNKREPRREQLQKIAAALDVPLYKLMGFDDSIWVKPNLEREKIAEEAQKIIIKQANGEEITKEESLIVSDYIKRTRESYYNLTKDIADLALIIDKYLKKNTQISKENHQLLKEKLQLLKELIPEMPEFYKNLNNIGRQKAVEQIDLLTKIPEYQKNPADPPQDSPDHK